MTARKFSVLWLGTKEEFGFTDKYIFKLSDYYEELTIQTIVLAKCAYFVGNDSGFAHIAGLLDIPGTVLFSATHPKDVIARYPLLTGVHAFDELGIEPTRSLYKDDPQSLRALNALTVDMVLKASGFNAIVCIPVVRNEMPTQKRRLAVVGCGATEELTKKLSDSYDTTYLTNMPVSGSEYEAILLISSSCNRLLSKDKVVNVDVSDPELVLRAVREILLCD